MPYVPQERRPNLDKVVESMWINCIYPGDINYVLFAYAKRQLTPKYAYYRNYLGELTEAVHEIRRRLLVPYEEKKKDEEGDV